MIEKFFLRKLTKKGKIAFFSIQVILDLLLVYVLFFVLDYTLGNIGSIQRQESSMILFPGILFSAVISGFICLQKWKIEQK